VTGRWFCLGTAVSSINKTDHHVHDIIEILLKVVFNTINQINQYKMYINIYLLYVPSILLKVTLHNISSIKFYFIFFIYITGMYTCLLYINLFFYLTYMYKNVLIKKKY